MSFLELCEIVLAIASIRCCCLASVEGQRTQQEAPTWIAAAIGMRHDRDIVSRRESACDECLRLPRAVMCSDPTLAITMSRRAMTKSVCGWLNCFERCKRRNIVSTVEL
ncbi:hypothetical protein M378DRAFT_161049, partial [Amanita muscaria Koide BX008]